jgi:XTP/dITP diphosphohydrolase
MKFAAATKNLKKLEELKRILSPLGIEVVCEADGDFEMPEVDETGETFAENAKLKADCACKVTGLPSIADDSGLCVDALGGAPGVYSARYSGVHGNDDLNNQKLLSQLGDLPLEKRSAHYACAICIVFPNGDELNSFGTCEGYIDTKLTGNHGFGYDPLFLVNGVSFGVLPSDEKDKISHRGKALREIKEKLTEYLKENKEC